MNPNLMIENENVENEMKVLDIVNIQLRPYLNFSFLMIRENKWLSFHRQYKN